MAGKRTGRLWVGTSGWIYPHWLDVFYPHGLAQSEWLSFYAEGYPAVELNYSFYRLPSRENFERWRRATPEGFLFAVKASRFITHMRKLHDVQGPLATFLSHAEGLGPKLGPVLFQFPENWHENLDRLRNFLDLLPAGHQYAFEFRHSSWLIPSVYEALASHRCALCIPDHPSLPRERRVTAEYTYVRMHSGNYSARYTEEELVEWAGWLAGVLAAGVDAHVYFNNDVAGYALENARELRRLLRDI